MGLPTWEFPETKSSGARQKSPVYCSSIRVKQEACTTMGVEKSHKERKKEMILRRVCTACVTMIKQYVSILRRHQHEPRGRMAKVISRVPTMVPGSQGVDKLTLSQPVLNCAWEKNSRVTAACRGESLLTFLPCGGGGGSTFREVAATDTRVPHTLVSVLCIRWIST